MDGHKSDLISLSCRVVRCNLYALALALLALHLIYHKRTHARHCPYQTELERANADRDRECVLATSFFIRAHIRQHIMIDSGAGGDGEGAQSGTPEPQSE